MIPISYGQFRKRGGGVVKPSGFNQNRCLLFISEKEKKMQNVLKWKNILRFFKVLNDHQLYWLQYGINSFQIKSIEKMSCA